MLRGPGAGIANSFYLDRDKNLPINRPRMKPAQPPNHNWRWQRCFNHVRSIGNVQRGVELWETIRTWVTSLDHCPFLSTTHRCSAGLPMPRASSEPRIAKGTIVFLSKIQFVGMQLGLRCSDLDPFVGKTRDSSDRWNDRRRLACSDSVTFQSFRPCTKALVMAGRLQGVPCRRSSGSLLLGRNRFVCKRCLLLIDHNRNWSWVDVLGGNKCKKKYPKNMRNYPCTTYENIYSLNTNMYILITYSGICA